MLESNEDLTEYREILTEYNQVRNLIDTGRAEVKLGPIPMDEALLSLKKLNITSIKLNELVIKPEIFDGKHPKPRRWLLDYEEAIIANGWDDFIAIKYLPTFLKNGSDAKAWYITEIKPYKNNPNARWEGVHDAFCTNYLSEGDSETLRKEVERAVQLPNESASAYIPRMRHLLLLFDPLMSEGEQLRQLKLKLRPEYKKLIAISEPSTIARLKATLIKLESTSAKEPGIERTAKQARGRSKAQEQGQPRNFRRKTRRKFRRKSNPAPPRPQQSSSKPERRSQPKRFIKPQGDRKPNVVTCYSCGKFGHYSNECRSKPQGQRQTGFKARRNPARTVNAVVAKNSNTGQQPRQVLTIRQGQSSKAEQKPRFSISEIEQVNLLVGGGTLLRQKVLCNDVEVNAVVDTGAYVTVMDESIVNHFKWKVDGAGTPLVGADGNKLVSKGSTLVKIKLQIGRV